MIIRTILAFSFFSFQSTINSPISIKKNIIIIIKNRKINYIYYPSRHSILIHISPSISISYGHFKQETLLSVLSNSHSIQKSKTSKQFLQVSPSSSLY